MRCPSCDAMESRVLDSRDSSDGLTIRRRRECQVCSRRFTTFESIQLQVVKRSGVRELFNRDKVIVGVRKACKGRPVSEAQLARLGQQVEDSLRAESPGEITTQAVGVAILEPLKQLDIVAYLRFASVYKQYECAQDFIDEIHSLNESTDNEPCGSHHDTTAADSTI